MNTLRIWWERLRGQSSQGSEAPAPAAVEDWPSMDFPSPEDQAAIAERQRELLETDEERREKPHG